MPIDPYAALQALLRAEATRTKSDPPEKTEASQNPHQDPHQNPHRNPQDRPHHLDPKAD